MEPFEIQSEEKLFHRLQQGDTTAFMELYAKHRDQVFRFACRVLGSQDHAEDVTHDCFLALMRNSGTFDSQRGTLRSYLLATARNLCLKKMRRSKFEHSVENPVESSSPQDGPLGHMLDREISSKVRSAITRLPVSEREVLVLFEYEGLSVREISRIIGRNQALVKWYLHQARVRLRRELAPFLNGGLNCVKEDKCNVARKTQWTRD